MNLHSFRVKRLVALCIDTFSIALVAQLVVWWFPLGQTPWVLFLSSVLFLALAKDSVGGASLGKRFTKLQVVLGSNTMEPVKVSSIKCLVRNLTVIIFPIELLWLLFSPQRRLGDYMANTQLVQVNEVPSFKEHFTIADLLLPLCISLACSVVLLQVLSSWSAPALSPKFYPVLSSYNATQSDSLCEALSHHFDDVVNSVEVSMYNETQNDSVPFVRSIIYVSQSHPSLKRLSGKVMNLLSEQNTLKSFILDCEFVVVGQSQVHTQHFFLDTRN